VGIRYDTSQDLVRIGLIYPWPAGNSELHGFYYRILTILKLPSNIKLIA
jgi:hypothetical protein